MSTNGVFLNGVSVTDSSVAAGDVVRVGNWVGWFAAGALEHNPGHVRELGPHLWGGDVFARALEPVRASARSRLPVTLIGESGTGKRLIARTVHGWSGRRGPFHTLNCATISPRQLEKELFGQRARGGATAHPGDGLVRASEGGTLLLEEASELRPALQERLVRTLGLGEPDSDQASGSSDVRLVLTRQHQHVRASGPLAAACAAPARGVELRLLPLSQRVPEIPALFSHFLSVYSKGELFALDAELVETLCLYAWPGNVRELEFLARQLVALHQDAREVGRQQLPRRILDAVKRRAQGQKELGSGTAGDDAAALADTARSAIPAVPTSGQ